MNKQGKIASKVSMFGNRYPVKEIGKFFGASNNVGAQQAWSK